MIESLLRVLQNTEADISICGLQEDSVGNIPAPSTMKTNARKELSPEDAISNILLHVAGYIPVSNKLYRKKIFNGISFSIGKYYEDVYWSYRVMAKSTKIVYLDTVLYHNVLRQGSITRDYDHFYQIDRVDACKERLEFCRRHFPSLENLALRSYMLTCYELYMELAFSHQRFDSNVSFRHELHQRFCGEQWWKVVWGNSLKKRIRLLLFRLCPLLLVHILYLYKTWRQYLFVLNSTRVDSI